MKTHLLLWLLAFALAAPLPAQDNTEQADSTGLPGDGFSLEAAIELFKTAESPEDFEKKLNAPDNKVNNLDLNSDGEVDYIQVFDQSEGEAHALVLRALVSEKEAQDVAVIEIEKQGKEEAILQIVGDEDIFGQQTIAEPTDEAMQDKPKPGGNALHPTVVRVVVNVWVWPSVRFVYRPGYVLWASPWRWRHYPVWWHPFRPHPFAWFRAAAWPFHRHYAVVTTHRVVVAHRVYAPRRVHSATVHTRTTTVWKARGPHGGTVVGKRTHTEIDRPGRRHDVERTTTKVHAEGPRGGEVKVKKTKVKKRRN